MNRFWHGVLYKLSLSKQLVWYLVDDIKVFIDSSIVVFGTANNRNEVGHFSVEIQTLQSVVRAQELTPPEHFALPLVDLERVSRIEVNLV